MMGNIDYAKLEGIRIRAGRGWRIPTILGIIERSYHPELSYKPLDELTESERNGATIVGLYISSNGHIERHFGDMRSPNYSNRGIVVVKYSNNGKFEVFGLPTTDSSSDLQKFIERSRKIDPHYMHYKEFLESLIMYGGEGGR